MPSKKIVHLQQFDTIYLPNSDLTYMRNPERETKLCYVFPPLETYIRNPEIETKYFYVLPPLLLRNGCATHTHARRWEGCQVTIDVKLFCQTVVGNFPCFAKIR
jgi:hypothetical protein